MSPVGQSKQPEEALESGEIRDIEFPFLRDRRQRDKLPVFPVICEECDWRTHDWLRATQAPHGCASLPCPEAQGRRRSGNVCRGISTTSSAPTRIATSPAAAFCAPTSCARASFYVLPEVSLKALEELFRARVIMFLVHKRLLPPERAHTLRGWMHSGFNVYRKPPCSVRPARRPGAPRPVHHRPPLLRREEASQRTRRGCHLPQRHEPQDTAQLRGLHWRHRIS